MGTKMIDWIKKNKDVVLAILEGKEIEYKSYRGYDNFVWAKCTNLNEDTEVRVKPEPVYRPFTYDEFFDLMLQKRLLIKVKDGKVVYNSYDLGINGLRINGVPLSFNQLLERYEIVFEDKTIQPCGVLK